MPPGRTSRMLISASLMARPIAAVARSLLPNALNVPAAPSSRRIGPFSTISTAQPPVEEVAPCSRNSGRSMAAKAVSTTGKCIGRQPAMTALMASFSAVMADAAHRLDAEQLAGRGHRPVEAGLDGLRRRRDDRQAVGPAVGVVQFLRRVDVIDVVGLRGEQHGPGSRGGWEGGGALCTASGRLARLAGGCGRVGARGLWHRSRPGPRRGWSDPEMRKGVTRGGLASVGRGRHRRRLDHREK